MSQYTHTISWKSVVCSVLFLGFSFICLPLTAQNAEFLEDFASSYPVTQGQLRTLLESAGINASVVDGDAPLRAGQLAYVIMQLSDANGNLGYRLFPGPRYAIRTLRDDGLLPQSPRRLSTGMAVDGTTTLQLLRSTLSSAVASRTALQTDPAPPIEIAPGYLLGPPGGPWLEWDMVHKVGVTYHEFEEGTTEFASASALDTQLIFSANARLAGRLEMLTVRADDGSESIDLRVTQARIDLFQEEATDTWNGSLSVGRIDDRPVVHDGVAAALSTGTVLASVSAGYTGLVAADLNNLPMKQNEDLTDRPFGEGTFSPEWIITTGHLLFPEVWGRQNPSLAVVSLLDPDGSDPITQVRFRLSGPIGIPLFYNIQTDLQLGAQSGWASQGSLRWYPGTSRTTQFELGALVAGSDAESDQGYAALDVDLPWTAYQGSFSNIAAGLLRYTARLGEPWLVSATSIFLGRLDSDGTGDPVLTEHASDTGLFGWEGVMNFGFQPISDLFFELNSNIFIPWTEEQSGPYPKSADPLWSVGGQLTVRL